MLIQMIFYKDYNMQKNPSNKFKKAIIIIIIYVILSVALVIFFLIINNTYKLSEITKEMPAEYSEQLTTSLERFLNSEGGFSGNIQNLPVRKDSIIEENTNGITMLSFIIDVDSIKQSFLIHFSYPVPNNQNLENLTIECVPLDKVKYKDSNCITSSNSTALLKAEQENPIYKLLPLSIYDETEVGGEPSKLLYEINGNFKDNSSFEINIIDYQGGNYENALNQIRAMGFNPNDYKVNYIDKTS